MITRSRLKINSGTERLSRYDRKMLNAKRRLANISMSLTGGVDHVVAQQTRTPGFWIEKTGKSVLRELSSLKVK